MSLFTNLFLKKVTLFKKAFFCDLRLKFKKRLKNQKKVKNAVIVKIERKGTLSPLISGEYHLNTN